MPGMGGMIIEGTYVCTVNTNYIKKCLRWYRELSDKIAIYFVYQVRAVSSLYGLFARIPGVLLFN